MYPGHVRVFMFIVIILLLLLLILMTIFHLIGSFPDKRFDSFGPLYIPAYKKQHMKKNDVPVPVDDSRMCPLGVYYDADVHDALSNLRKLDGDIPVHPQYVACLLFFLPRKNRVSTGPSPLPLNWGTSFRTV